MVGSLQTFGNYNLPVYPGAQENITMKRMLIIAAVFAAAIFSVVQPGTTGARAQELQPTADGLPNKIWKRGLAIAPVALNLDGKDKILVGEGSYIVNGAGDCNSCHTTNTNPYLAGGNPFMSQPEMTDPDRYLVGGRAFGTGGNISRNLRPRADTGLPAGYTFEQFRTVMRTGADLKNRLPNVPSADNDLLQVMPWPLFKTMTDRDIEAIYAYLAALPPHPGFPE
jgi:mono/diheme cytochrome c family protein